jgi:hypothetical protein
MDIGYDDGLAITGVGGGGLFLIWQHEALCERSDGTGAMLFGAGLALVGGLSWFLCKAGRSWWKGKKKD